MVQADSVSPCNATSPCAFISMLSQDRASKTRFLRDFEPNVRQLFPHNKLLNLLPTRRPPKSQIGSSCATVARSHLALTSGSTSLVLLLTATRRVDWLFGSSRAYSQAAVQRPVSIPDASISPLHCQMTTQ